MKTNPQTTIDRKDLNLRLGIKSSLYNLRSVIALLYALYVANGKQSRVNYSKEVVMDGITKLELETSLLSPLASILNVENPSDLKVNDNPLFKAQMESLQVGIELFFKLGKVLFTNNSLVSSCERKGGHRYQKYIEFSSNMQLLDLFLSQYADELPAFLMKWLGNEDYEVEEINNGVKKILTILTEETQFKIKTSGGDVIFQQEGVYKEIADGNTVENSSQENVGPFRVLKSFIKEGLHPYIKDSNDGFVAINLDNTTREYFKMVSTCLDLIPKRTTITADEQSSTLVTTNDSLTEYQTIFYGCPGTGKSHMVEGIVRSAGEVVPKEDTSESRNIKFHEYLRNQPYFSTGDTYHFALRNKGQKGLYTILKKEKWIEGDIESCFDITDVNVWDEIENKIKELHPFHNEYYEDITLHAIDYYIKFLSEKEDVKVNTLFRTTFHPDSDYASFVGCYKPTMIEGEDNENRISYEFVPQVFTNAYVRAWELYNSGSKENVYLVIEEINRGNCAQIFGDLFQLLDRYEDGDKAGFSKYEVDPDADLSQYLIGLFDKHHCAKKLCLPPNLHILATMNTSDQSLFPMDSAFKRRWSWKYVPIDYEHKASSKYTITIGDRTYSWNKFLQDVNERIKTITQSEDKQIGNFFIAHADIKQDEFINKVMFYLWSEICKDNYKTRDNFFRNRNNKDEEFSFNDLFGKDATALLQGFMAYIAGEDAKVVEEQEESHEVEG